ncbi:hypothetical protein GQ53DRAFT_77040 [Thozetella sp. PMI_491]|nr:hypothetical protein GQ53DRAFT_77040 [Thozetella sp. PMI_491]
MKAPRSAAVALLSLSTIASAWPAWPRWLPELDSLVVRDDSSGSSTSTPTASSPNSTPTNVDLNTAGASSAAPSGSDSSGASATGSSTGKVTGKASASQTGKTTKHTTYDVSYPVGSVVMTQPAATDGTQLYKIKDYITWGWNYTNLQATPTAVDVLISCSSVSATWTLTSNMTYQSQASYTWDSGKFQADNPQSQLPVAEYTLLVYEAGSSISATSEPGYLAPFSGFRFGLYTPKAATPLGEYVCATCSAAMSEMERRGLGAVFIMCIVTVMSFTWFVTGFAGLTI